MPNYLVIGTYEQDGDVWAQDFQAPDAAAAFAAARQHARDEDLDINFEGAVECPQDSTWHEPIEPTACDECQEMLDTTAGDGWAGLCPSCADKAEQLLEEEV